MNISRNNIIFLLIVFVLIFHKKIFKTIENFSNSYQFKCKRRLGKVMDLVSVERGMNKNNEVWDFHFPCTYNTCEMDARKIKIDNPDQKVFLIDGCDRVNSKVALWNALLTQYGRKKACQIMPDTYILNN